MMRRWIQLLIFNELEDMKVRIKLYGTLMKYYPGYEHEHGLDMEVPAGTDVEGLIAALGIPQSKIGMISVNGNPAKSGDHLLDNAVVKLFQPIFGG